METRTLTACLIVAIAATVSAQTPALTVFKARAEAVRRIDASRQNLTDPQARAEMALHGPKRWIARRAPSRSSPGRKPSHSHRGFRRIESTSPTTSRVASGY